MSKYMSVSYVTARSKKRKMKRKKKTPSDGKEELGSFGGRGGVLSFKGQIASTDGEYVGSFSTLFQYNDVVCTYSTYLTPKQKACQLYVVCIHTQLHIHNYVTSCVKNSKAKESTKGVLYCTCTYLPNVKFRYFSSLEAVGRNGTPMINRISFLIFFSF